MRAIIAAGGTAGHINPALAIAGEIMKNEPDSKILFIGRVGGMEAKLVPAAGFELREIEMHGFSRNFKIRALIENVKTVICALRAEREAKRIFLDFQPDVVIGCGGYVSGPIVRKAAKMGYPTAIQEQNSFPGVTTKLLAKQVDLVMAASDDAFTRMDTKDALRTVTGNPVRDAFFTASREKLRRLWGVGDRVCVVSFGGSLGARTINELTAAFMELHAATGRVYHIHATGQYGVKLLPELLEKRGVDVNNPNLRIVEYIDNMPECFAAADLVIARAGAITLSEIAAAGKASVLIPSPNVAENHQYYNAKTLENAGAALLYEEKGLEVDRAAQQIWDLCRNRTQLRLMGVNARRVAIPNSANRIYTNIRKIVKKKGEKKAPA